MDKLEIDVHMNQTEFDKYVIEKLANAQSQTLGELITFCKTLSITKTKARKSIIYNNRTDYNYGKFNSKPQLKPDFNDTIRAIKNDYSNEHLFNVLVRDSGFLDFKATKVTLY